MGVLFMCECLVALVGVELDLHSTYCSYVISREERARVMGLSVGSAMDLGN